MFFDQPFGGIIPGVRGAVLAALLRTGTELTGRQVHTLVSENHSLWTVQQSLKALTDLGLVETRTIGRAGVHTVNDGHASVAPLRALLDPIETLRQTITAVAQTDVQAVLLFGSIARGEATPDSDIDLAVIGPAGWDRRVELEDTVHLRLGNDCDVLAFTASEFRRLAAAGEPVVGDILRDGVPLIGEMPRLKHVVA